MYLFGKTRKLISWLLVAVMLIGMFPMGAFAAEAEAPVAPETEPVVTTDAPENTETPEAEAPAQEETPETEPIVSEEALAGPGGGGGFPGGGNPGGGSSDIYSHTFGHIDVRIQSASLTFTYTVYDIDGKKDPDASYTENVECNVTKVEYVVVNGTTYTGFSQSGTYEWRKTKNVSIQVTDDSTATIVCDLVSKDGSKTYNDVEINYTFAGIKAAAENCNGYKNGRYDGLDFDVAKNDIYTIHMEAVSIAGEKIWEDGNNQDGIRPESITINLLANDEVIATKTVTAAEGWKYDFGRLPKTDKDGKDIRYEIQEVAVPGYTTAYDGNNIVNTHAPSFTSLSGSKTWDDNNNQDGIRPASITVQLLANNNVVKTVTVSAENNWAWSFTDLPMYENGEKIVYTVAEVPVEGYTPTYNGGSITNTHTPSVISIPVSKIWNDADNQDGIRPESITVNLLADGNATGRSLTLSAASNWSGVFTDLPEKANGKAITYTIEEVAVSGYTVSIDGYTITNTHEVELTSVSGKKTWEDNNNQDGKRPASITIHLLANGEVVDTITVTEADGWAWSFTNLPKNKAGEEITYSITEEVVENYSTKYNGYNVINSYTPAETSVSVSKSWVDNNNQDGIRPNTITVVLVKNGQPTEQTLVLSSGNNWTGSFTGLPVYENGTAIVYTIQELAVEGYTSAITGDASTGYTITNSHTPAVVSVSGSKTWEDNNNQDGARPKSITINLVAGGKVKQSITVTEADGWKWSFTDLPKYENGEEIVYSITEDAVEDYSTEYNGYNVTNTHTPAETSVSVSKAWVDSNNQDGIRPYDIIVELYADDVATGKTLVLSSGNNWTGSFTGLPVYENGTAIVYTVKEIDLAEGYTAVITGDATIGFTITNTHTPETIAIEGAKTWNDSDNQDGKRPTEITINLLADGVEIQEITVTEADGWAWTFENLPKYAGGKEIVYSITEDAVEDYSTEYDGYNVVNTYAPEKTSVTVTKAWDDSNNQDGIRPDSITVVLLANGEETGEELILSAENNWTGSFTELDKYAAGVEIVYTVEEIAIEGYSTVITGDAATGYTITNSHSTETVEVSGRKYWDDGDNQDGKRPDSITIHLLANREVVDTITVTEADGWAWSFVGLPKYENGKEIVYTISEDGVEDYKTSYDGYDVYNEHDPENINISVRKVWKDNDDADDKRPNSITVYLYADGKLVETVKITAADGWKHTFEDLPKYADGEKIKYTIEEKDVDGYNTVISGTAADGFTITNSRTTSPKTGDNRNSLLWTGILLASACLFVVALVPFKKRRSAK